jgi:hypothetical protein
LLRDPRGGVEDVLEMREAGVKWLALNVGDFPMTAWATVLNRAAAIGVAYLPWARLAQPGEPSSAVQGKLELLAQVGRAWNAPAILPNYEKEAETVSPAAVAKMLLMVDWPRLVGFSTQGWLANDVDFGPLNAHPVLLQCFPTDAGWQPADVRQKTLQCVTHARDKGFVYVGCTFQTYADALPDWYDIASFQHSLYPGDGLFGQWGKWFL